MSSCDIAVPPHFATCRPSSPNVTFGSTSSFHAWSHVTGWSHTPSHKAMERGDGLTACRLNSDVGRDYIGARTDTTQRSGQTPDKEVDINHITVYVSSYTETDTTRRSQQRPTVWRQHSGFVSNWQSAHIPVAVCVGFECCCNGQNVSNRTCYRYAASLGPKRQKLL